MGTWNGLPFLGHDELDKHAVLGSLLLQWRRKLRFYNGLGDPNPVFATVAPLLRTASLSEIPNYRCRA